MGRGGKLFSDTDWPGHDATQTEERCSSARVEPRTGTHWALCPAQRFPPLHFLLPGCGVQTAFSHRQAWCTSVLFTATPLNSPLPGIRVQCPAGPLHPLGFIHSSVKCGHTDFWDIPPVPSGTLQCLLSGLCLCQPLKSFLTGPCRLLAAAPVW